MHVERDGKATGLVGGESTETVEALAEEFTQALTRAGFEEVSVHDRASIAVGSELAGPAVVEDGGSTIWVPPGYRVLVLGAGELELRR